MSSGSRSFLAAGCRGREERTEKEKLISHDPPPCSMGWEFVSGSLSSCRGEKWGRVFLFDDSRGVPGQRQGKPQAASFELSFYFLWIFLRRYISMELWARVGMVGALSCYVHRKKSVLAEAGKSNGESGSNRGRPELKLVQVLFRHGARTPLRPIPGVEQVSRRAPQWAK